MRSPPTASSRGISLIKIAYGIVAIEDTEATQSLLRSTRHLGMIRSMLGLIGNLFAGWKRVPKHLDQAGEATGWFRRSMGGYLILLELNRNAGALRAQALLLQVVLSLIVIVGNFILI